LEGLDFNNLQGSSIDRSATIDNVASTEGSVLKFVEDLEEQTGLRLLPKSETNSS
jgi:hypothetical protein